MAHRHYAVCGEKYRRRDIVKFRLLILPACAEIAFELWIGFELWITMGREHFAVSIDVHTLSLCLLKKKLHVMEIMTAHNDKRTFFYGKGNFRRHRVAVGFCVCGVKKCHTFQVNSACFKHTPQQLFGIVLASYGAECLIEKACHFTVRLAKSFGMISIRRHAFYAEQN